MGMFNVLFDIRLDRRTGLCFNHIAAKSGCPEPPSSPPVTAVHARKACRHPPLDISEQSGLYDGQSSLPICLAHPAESVDVYRVQRVRELFVTFGPQR
jgi:hypothetical protein